MRITVLKRCLAVTVLPVLFMAGCAKAPVVHEAAPQQPAVQAPPPMKVAVSPADQAADQPISTEIGIEVSDGKVESVTLADDKGQQVAGRMRADDTSWVPDEPLKPSQRYTATIVAKGADRGETLTRSFTTMGEPSNRVGTGLYMFDGNEYGVAMPVVVEFTSDVEPEARAGVEKRLFVTTTPEQPGVWHWTGSRQVTYRAEKYWQPGTTIAVRAALDGTPLGAGKYGDQDRRASATVATNRVELFIDNATKQLTVHENGVPTRQIPVSLGKSSTPSSSGTMVIMDKKTQTVFDTTGEPGDQYRADVSYAQRLTWGGEFIHAAPWSVGDQGVNNVSHGCVNMSWENAEWLFSVTHIGDPVTVTGTEVQLTNGNGFTAWNLPWDEYVKGSALPGR